MLPPNLFPIFFPVRRAHRAVRPVGPRLLLVIGLAAVVAALPATALAGTRTYKGKNYDANSGTPAGKLTIKAKTARSDGQKLLKVRVSCSPSRKCTVLKKAKFKLFPTGEPFEYEGTFKQGSATCEISGFVYKQGFQTTYDCDDGKFGSISGMR